MAARSFILSISSTGCSGDLRNDLLTPELRVKPCATPFPGPSGTESSVAISCRGFTTGMPVVTSLDLSSSSPTSSSSTLRPGKKKPIILWKNWCVSWMVRGTTFTSKCSLTEIPPTGGRTLLKRRSASCRPDWQELWGRRTTL